MRDLYKILDRLITNGVYFNFQHQNHVGGKWFNLTVDDPQEKRTYLHGDNIEIVEEGIKLMWGHVLTEIEVPKKVFPAFPMPKGM